MEPVIRATGLKKKYGGRTVLDVESIRVERGEILVCLGPSGAGKSVLMRLLNLLERPTRGQIFFKGREVQDLKGGMKVQVSRQMAMLFQDPLLFNGTVADNVAYGLKVRRVGRPERESRVARSLEMINLGSFGEENSRTLSGGEAQRVALARALVFEPEMVFLDEPFANLDRLTREALQREVKRILKANGYSSIFVTHDQDEAALMGDRILILNEGRVVQEGSTLEIFQSPSTEFAARFVGMDNLYDGTIESSAGGLASIAIDGGRLEAVTERGVGQRVTAGIRPEDVALVTGEAKEDLASTRNAFSGKVVDVEHIGPTVRVTVDCPFPVVSLITRRSLLELGIETGTCVQVRFKAVAVRVIGDERTPGRP